MQAKHVFIGIDVAKSTLVIAMDGQAKPITLANEEAAVKRWLRTLPLEAMVAMESTGRYHQMLAELVHRSGRKVYVLNAKDVWFYARGLGVRSKTDRVDAEVIARYVAEHHAELHSWEPGSQGQRRVQALVQRRARISDHRGSIRQLLVGMKELAPALRLLEARFEGLLKQIDRLVKQEIASEAQLQERYKLLRTVVGFGPQGAALLAAITARIKFANADALVAYSGLDPRADDSGTKRGRRCLSKRGNASLRRQLYMAALAAGRSAALGPTYRALKARGLATTESLVILGRKLLRIAWAVLKTDQPFDPARFAPRV